MNRKEYSSRANRTYRRKSRYKVRSRSKRTRSRRIKIGRETAGSRERGKRK